MREWATVSRVLIWVVLAFSLFFQIGTIISIHNYDTAMDVRSSYETGFLTLCTVLMTVSVVLFMVLRRGKLIPLIAMTIIGICFVAIAASLHEYYGMPKGTTGIGDYLTVGEALYRHALPALLPILMVPVWLVHREDVRERARAEEEEAIPSVLGGLTGFKMTSLEEPSKPEHKRRKN